MEYKVGILWAVRPGSGHGPELKLKSKLIQMQSTKLRHRPIQGAGHVKFKRIGKAESRKKNCLSVINTRAEIEFQPELARLGQIAPMVKSLQGQMVMMVMMRERRESAAVDTREKIDGKGFRSARLPASWKRRLSGRITWLECLPRKASPWPHSHSNSQSSPNGLPGT